MENESYSWKATSVLAGLVAVAEFFIFVNYGDKIILGILFSTILWFLFCLVQIIVSTIEGKDK